MSCVFLAGFILESNKQQDRAKTEAAKIIVSFAYFVLSFFFLSKMLSALNGVYSHLRLFKIPTMTKRKLESSLPRRQQMAYSVSFVY